MTPDEARLILDVGIGASNDEIRYAHWCVTHSIHPDTNSTEEAERLTRRANEALDILDPSALADEARKRLRHVEGPFARLRRELHESFERDGLNDNPLPRKPRKKEFEAARLHLAAIAEAIRTHLDTAYLDPDPYERTLNTYLEVNQPGKHVCDVVWDELGPRGVAEDVVEAVCTMACQKDFLENGQNGGYWAYNEYGSDLHSVLDVTEPIVADANEREEEAKKFWPSFLCIFFGVISLCMNIGQLLLGSSDVTRDVMDSLMALQVVLGTGAYRSRKLRFRRSLPNTIGRRLGELGRLVATILCGVAMAARATEVAIVTTGWILGAYALAGTFVTKRQQRAFTRAREWFQSPPAEHVHGARQEAKRARKKAKRASERPASARG